MACVHIFQIKVVNHCRCTWAQLLHCLRRITLCGQFQVTHCTKSESDLAHRILLSIFTISSNNFHNDYSKFAFLWITINKLTAQMSSLLKAFASPFSTALSVVGITPNGMLSLCDTRIVVLNLYSLCVNFMYVHKSSPRHMMYVYFMLSC